MTTKGFTEVDAKAAAELLASPERPILIDVREQNEWDAGYLRGATHAPKGTISFAIGNIAPDRSAPILLYCAGGVRSAAAAETLAGLGYTNLRSLAGGINGWSAAGLPVVETTTLTPAQKSRYSRHLLLPGVGAEGQQKLLNSRVLMVGAGGLGAPAREAWRLFGIMAEFVEATEHWEHRLFFIAKKLAAPNPYELPP